MISNKTLIPAVIVAKLPGNSKSELEVMAKQVAQLTTACVPQNIYIEDIVISYAGIKDIEKKIASLTEHKDIKVVLIYSAKQVASTEKEFYEFVATMADFYRIKVICFR